ncbi:MAG: hypothetical protein DCF15_02050 [Phormidesmis priestleyi]|uniref:Uncharacterized protein n=1 Tax=Phormidesmis priestleyi TaxID=268141 RepID=A0A2W4ZZK2_9CYAN|nr:MAG: hypothetical protein DCF15_02050 [Phormidesmis priestleyi]
MEAKQLSEDLKSSDEETKNDAKSDVANANFEKEYEIAQQNENGSGTQSSDSNPVTRQSGSISGGTQAQASGVSKSEHSPGDSDPKDYVDMAKDITKNVEAAK